MTVSVLLTVLAPTAVTVGLLLIHVSFRQRSAEERHEIYQALTRERVRNLPTVDPAGTDPRGLKDWWVR